jgi:hypothetical protein
VDRISTLTAGQSNYQGHEGENGKGDQRVSICFLYACFSFLSERITNVVCDNGMKELTDLKNGLAPGSLVVMNRS